MKKHNPNWLDDLKAGRSTSSLLEGDDTTWFDELVDQAERQKNQRATDSAIAAAVTAGEPSLARAQFRKAIRRLEEYFETSLDATGPQKSLQVLARIHGIIGDRRRKRK